MGVPTDCGAEFEVARSGKNKEEAKAKADAKARELCVGLKKGCDVAVEVGKGNYRETTVHGETIVTYTSTYMCIGL